MGFDVRWDAGGGQFFNYRVAAIIQHDGYILLGRGANKSFWHLPGGGVELGEASSAALTREIREELAVEPTAMTLRIVSENFFGDTRAGTDRQVSEIAFYYSCELPGDEIADGEFFGPEGEGVVFRWFEMNELGSLDLRPNEVRDLLPALASTVVHLQIGFD